MKTVLTLSCLLVITFSARAQSAALGPIDLNKIPAAAAKEAEPPKIEGVEVPRAAGGFLGVAIENGSFKISFYDAKKKPIEVDVARALLRWDPKNKIGQERLVLNPTADGKALSASKNVRPPYVFKLFITLLKDAAESAEPVAGESYVIDFKA